MDTKKIFLTILSIVFKINFLFAIPSISNVVTLPTNNVELYSNFEVTFNLNNYSNPYNPNIINSYCEFWSPSGKYHKVYGFYYEDYTKTNTNCSPFPCEILTPNGIKNWKVRFTPNETGNWQYNITAIDNSGNTIYPTSNKLYFTCIASSNEGFIEKANNKFFKRTTGEFFFPVGENVTSYTSPKYRESLTYGTNEYKYYIDSLSYNKANFIRVFLDVYEGMALVGYDYTLNTMFGFDLYNQKDAYQLDWIFNYAKTKGINITLCLFNYTSWGDSDKLFCWGSWSGANPYKNKGIIETPYQFFSNTTAINETENILKYIVSRWGYSTNLVAWELWNEVNQIQPANPTLTPPSTFRNDISNWHQRMYNFIKSIDPYKHLITTSFAGEYSSNNIDVFRYMDFSQTHNYTDFDTYPEAMIDFQYHLFGTTKLSMNNFNKPYVTGEWGYDKPEPWTAVDSKGVELHNSLWSSSFSTAFGSASNWWWNNYIDPNHLYYLYKPVSVFMNSLPIPSELFYPHSIVKSNGLRAYYMKNTNSDTIYGWIQDINFQFKNLNSSQNGKNYLQTLDPTYKPNPSSSFNTINIPVNQNNKQYIVKLYSAETGLEIQSQTKISYNLKIEVDIPSSLRTSTFGDAVFAIYLDCDKFIWREGVLSDNTYQNVSGNIVCDKINGQVYYKTFDNKIHAMWWDQNSNSWQWSALNNSANNVAGDLVIKQDGSQIFYRTIDNKINAIWWDSNIQNWQWSTLNNSANNVAGDLAINQDGNQIFYKTIDNKINAICWNSNIQNWQWSELNQAANGNVKGPIAVNSNGQAFYRTLDNKLNAIWWDSYTGIWNWSNLNNAANSNVSDNITINTNNQVFYRTLDNKLNAIWWDSYTGIWNWSSLNNAANNVAGDIMADITGKIFYRTTNSNINCIYWSNGSWFLSNLDNSTSSNVYPGNIATDDLGNIFFRGSNNSIHRIYYKSQCFNISSTSFQEKALIDRVFSENISNDKFDKNSESEILIYPNPANNKISVVTGKNIENLYIYNINGKHIKEIKNLNESEVEIDISKYNDGFYFIKAHLTNGELINSKFIIKH